MARVLNKRNGMPVGAVYVGRPSKWGNPFLIGRDGNRAEVIQKFTDYILHTPHLLNDMPELRGHDLVCWCAPDACHGDVLLRLANMEQIT